MANTPLKDRARSPRLPRLYRFAPGWQGGAVRRPRQSRTEMLRTEPGVEDRLAAARHHRMAATKKAAEAAFSIRAFRPCLLGGCLLGGVLRGLLDGQRLGGGNLLGLDLRPLGGQR